MNTFFKMLFVMLAVSIIAFGSLIVSCGDDDDDDDLGTVGDDDDDEPGTVFTQNFENQETGQLPNGWVIEMVQGASTATTEDIPDFGSGKALWLNGMVGGDDTLFATYKYVDISEDLFVEFDVYTEGETDVFGFQVLANIDDFPTNIAELRMQNGELMAVVDFVGEQTVGCGGFSAGAWHKVEIHLHWAAMAYDVKIDGQSGGCTGVSQKIEMQFPYAFVGIMDHQYEGTGGSVWFDNIKGSVVVDEDATGDDQE